MPDDCGGAGSGTASFRGCVRSARVGVAGQHALVDVLDGRERRAVAEQNIEEFQAVDVTAEHHEANGERGGQDQADRPITAQSGSPGPPSGRTA